jgi:hypothetical protein
VVAPEYSLGEALGFAHRLRTCQRSMPSWVLSPLRCGTG